MREDRVNTALPKVHATPSVLGFPVTIDLEAGTRDTSIGSTQYAEVLS